MVIEKLTEMILSSRYVVFFGGAGVSTESNIPDFRSESGIYNTIKNYGRPPEVILSHSFFISEPETFYDFYKNHMIYPDAKPNNAHIALAKLEQKGILKAVITQNIDGLHQAAGSKEVLELHGSIYRNYCMKCGKKYDLEYVMSCSGPYPACEKCGGIVRPDVTLYEESLDMRVLNKSISHIAKADMLIVGGTSLAVYPAAGLIDYYNGDRLVLINKSSTPYDSIANIVIHDSIGKVLGSVINSI
ncbi:MAG: NAD-dependent protein deacylase [Clostridiaceae bacterium]|nr:NAD-dependent protein deacylase [Clostridiaceae bacterium]